MAQVTGEEGGAAALPAIPPGVRRLLLRPPRSSPLGADVLPAGAGHPVAQGPAVRAQDGRLSREDLHLRATLRTGLAHRRVRGVRYSRRHTLLLDDSASVRSRLGEGGVEAVAALFLDWAGRHGLRAAVLRSSPGAAGAPHPWDHRVWERWHREVAAWNGGVALVLSDFHGEAPAGPFWTHLTARAEVMALRLETAWTGEADGGLVLDCEGEREEPEVYAWDAPRARAARDAWDGEVRRFLRRSGWRWASLTRAGLEPCLRAMFRLLCDPALARGG